MTPSRSDFSISRVELVILARLSSTKTPSDDDLAQAVSEVAMPDKSAHPNEIAAEALAQLRQRGLVDEPTTRARNRRGLTEAGVRVLRASFNLDKTPLWPTVRSSHLIAQALGLKPGSASAVRGVHDASTIASIIVRNNHKVAKLSEVADKLLAKVIGLPPGPTNIARIRAYILAKEAGLSSDLTAQQNRQIIIKLAADVLGERCHDKKTLGRVLIRRWVYEANSSQAVLTPRAQVSHPPSPSRLKISMPDRAQPLSHTPDALLHLVREAIPRVGADGRFGTEKVFVSALWRRIENDKRLSDFSFEGFKRWLLTANQEQVISLARADLMGSIDPKLLAESAIEDLGTTFHFVIDCRVNGARGAHAR